MEFVSLFSQENFIFGVAVGAFGCMIYNALLSLINYCSDKADDIVLSNRLKRAEAKNVELQNVLLSAELEEGSITDA